MHRRRRAALPMDKLLVLQLLSRMTVAIELAAIELSAPPAPRLAHLIAQARATMEACGFRRCAQCGCSDLDGCDVGDGEPCHWVAADRCSSCAPAR